MLSILNCLNKRVRYYTIPCWSCYDVGVIEIVCMQHIFLDAVISINYRFPHSASLCMVFPLLVCSSHLKVFMTCFSLALTAYTWMNMMYYHYIWGLCKIARERERERERDKERKRVISLWYIRVWKSCLLVDSSSLMLLSILEVVSELVLFENISIHPNKKGALKNVFFKQQRCCKSLKICIF